MCVCVRVFPCVCVCVRALRVYYEKKNSGWLAGGPIYRCTLCDEVLVRRRAITVRALAQMVQLLTKVFLLNIHKHVLSIVVQIEASRLLLSDEDLSNGYQSFFFSTTFILILIYCFAFMNLILIYDCTDSF